VWRLRRALYGLRSAPSLWFNHVKATLLKDGWTQSKFEYCCFYKDGVTALVYVDDILLIGNDEKISSVEKSFTERYDCKTIAPEKTKHNSLKYEFLGLELDYSKENKTVSIHQPKLIEKVLKDFPATKSARSPIAAHLNAANDSPVTALNYRSFVGSLMYLSTGSRPDLAFAVQFLSKSLDCPTEQSFAVGKRLVEYLSATRNKTLVLRDSEKKLTAYSDSDWAACKKTRKSISGGCIFAGKSLIYWRSKQQDTVSLSSCEAEYISACEIAKELSYLQNLYGELLQNMYGNSKLVKTKKN